MRKGQRKVKARILIEFIGSMDAEPTIITIAQTAQEATQIERAIRDALSRYKGPR